MKPLSILFVLLLTSPANGMVYSWIDSAGVAHYTNKEYEIPTRYRPKVKARYPEQGDSSTLPQNVQTPQVSPQKAQSPQAKQPVQPQPRTPQANHPKPVYTGQPVTQAEIKQMRKERTARKKQRNRRPEEE